MRIFVAGRAAGADARGRQRVNDVEDFQQGGRHVRLARRATARALHVAFVHHAELMLAKRDQRGRPDGSGGRLIGRSWNRPQRVVLAICGDQTFEASGPHLGVSGGETGAVQVRRDSGLRVRAGGQREHEPEAPAHGHLDTGAQKTARSGDC
jgi:hypothetical protein